MKNLDPFDYVVFFWSTIVIIGFISAPVIGITRVITTQQVINQECKTNYNFLQVALAGDNLSRLCQIKNQTVTIK